MNKTINVDIEDTLAKLNILESYIVVLTYALVAMV